MKKLIQGKFEKNNSLLTSIYSSVVVETHKNDQSCWQQAVITLELHCSNYTCNIYNKYELSKVLMNSLRNNLIERNNKSNHVLRCVN